MIKKWGITFKFVFFVLLSTSLVLIAILGYDYYVSRQYISRNIDKQLDLFSELSVEKIEETLRSVEQVPDVLATFLRDESFSEKGLEKTVLRIVEGSDRIFGIGVFFAPHAFKKDRLYYAPYCYKAANAVECKYLGSKDYDYFNMDWFKQAESKGKSLWSEPFFDLGGSGEKISTYSIPFYRYVDGKKIFIGVVGTDISFSWLQKVVSSLDFGERGFGFLIGRSGNLITHPKYPDIPGKNLFDTAVVKENKRLQDAMDDIKNGNGGKVSYRDPRDNDRRLLIYRPLPSSLWAVALDFQMDDIIEDLIDFDEYIILVAVAGLVALFVVIYLISRSITGSLRSLDASTREIAKGNLDFEPPKITTDDEVGRLSQSFISMRDSLKQHIKKLTETTAVKERMINELRIARQIQLSMVPKITPYFTSDDRFDLACALEPAKEVGGDFYDFYFLDRDHLFVAIGDVVGKGVPAALLMSMSRTLIKAMAKGGSDPVKILRRLSKEIFYNDQDGIFVTVFCAVIDLTNGELRYANAGHNPPLLIGHGVEFLPVFNGTAAGVLSDPEYREEKICLDEKTALLLYTDGVTEMFSKTGEMFGEEKLIETVSQVKDHSCPATVDTVLKVLRHYAGKKEQDDDIAMLSLRYLPGEKKNSSDSECAILTLKNDLKELVKLADFVETVGRDHNFNKKLILGLNLAIEEHFTNVVNYGFDDKNEHLIQIEIGVLGDVLEIQISDDGRPFNPLKESSPVRKESLKDTPSHGWGLVIVKNFADKLEYGYEGKKNVLTLKKAIKS